MRRILKFLTPIIRPAMIRYLSKSRNYSYQGISIVVHPGTFHPGFFFSSKLLMKFLEQKDMHGKNVLELGAGSGLISIYCCLRKGAHVVASDISTSVIANISENAKRNKANISVVHSDLFRNLDPTTFDVIIVNPPYYPRNPVTDSERAWYCGENFQYFRELYSQLQACNPSVVIYMILSEDCAIATIKDIAYESSFDMPLVYTQTKWGERNYIISG